MNRYTGSAGQTRPPTQEHTPLRQTEPPRWAVPDLWRPRTLIRGRIWGCDFTVRSRQMLAYCGAHPELADVPMLPGWFSYAADGWASTLDSRMQREERERLYKASITVKWKDDALVFRGIHAGDLVTFCQRWAPIVGEVVLAQKPAHDSGDPAWYAGIYRRDGEAEWLEYDGQAPWGQLVVIEGPFAAIWPVAEVEHRSDTIGDDCLDRYPPELFQPWWESEAEDRQRYGARPDPASEAVS